MGPSAHATGGGGDPVAQVSSRVALAAGIGGLLLFPIGVIIGPWAILIGLKCREGGLTAAQRALAAIGVVLGTVAVVASVAWMWWVTTGGSATAPRS